MLGTDPVWDLAAGAPKAAGRFWNPLQESVTRSPRWQPINKFLLLNRLQSVLVHVGTVIGHRNWEGYPGDNIPLAFGTFISCGFLVCVSTWTAKFQVDFLFFPGHSPLSSSGLAFLSFLLCYQCRAWKLTSRRCQEEHAWLHLGANPGFLPACSERSGASSFPVVPCCVVIPCSSPGIDFPSSHDVFVIEMCVCLTYSVSSSKQGCPVFDTLWVLNKY